MTGQIELVLNLSFALYVNKSMTDMSDLEVQIMLLNS